MKPEELSAINDSNKSKIMRSLSLGFVRQHASVKGMGKPLLSAPNRQTLRAQKFARSENSAFGQIYAQTVDPKKVEKRRAKNKMARKSRAANR